MNIPTNIKNLISPLLNTKIVYNKMIPVIIQNTMSSIVVIKSDVLKLLLSILNVSNNNPIINPSITKIKNKLFSK